MKICKIYVVLISLFILRFISAPSVGFCEIKTDKYQYSDDPYLKYINDPSGCYTEHINKYTTRRRGVQTTERLLKPFPEGNNPLRLKVISAETGKIIDNFRLRIHFDPGIFELQGFGESFRVFKGISDVVSIDNLPTGELIITVENPTYSPYQKVIAIPKDKYLEVSLHPKNASLKGKILDGSTKLPLERVQLEASYKEYDYEYYRSSVFTNKDGAFLLGPLSGIGYKMEVNFSKNGYFGKRIYKPGDMEWKEDLGNIYLCPEISIIKGSLTDAHKKPLRRHFIYIIGEKINYTDIETVGEALPCLKAGRRYPLVLELNNDSGAGRYFTDDRGNFSTSPIAPGKYTLVFGDLKNNVKQIEVECGKTKTVSLVKKRCSFELWNLCF